VLLTQLEVLLTLLEVPLKLLEVLLTLLEVHLPQLEVLLMQLEQVAVDFLQMEGRMALHRLGLLDLLHHYHHMKEHSSWSSKQRSSRIRPQSARTRIVR